MSSKPKTRGGAAKAGARPEGKPEAKPEAKTVAKTDTKAEAEAKPPAGAAAKGAAKPSAKPAAKSGSKAAPEPDAEGPIAIRMVAAEELAEVLDGLPPAHAAWARANGFKAAPGTSVALPGPEGAVERVLIGLGTEAQRRRERFHLGAFARTAPAGTYVLEDELADDEAESAALAWMLGRYRFDRYKAGEPEPEAELDTPDGVDGRRLGRIAEGVFIARDLINTPANDMGPAALERAARKLAERHGASVKVTAGDSLLEATLPMIHAVGRAGPEAPRLIDLRWGNATDPQVTLVGKGVCFDTGGLDIKPSTAMALMKKDMGGAATALGLAHMIMGLGLPVRLRVLIPAVENSISANSMRPGDILRSRKGLTVEVNNTDAEGRLILADALTLAAEDKPGLIIDLATLTGAARVALGSEVVPFYTDDEALAAELATASARVADPLWRMPLWPGYEADIEPDTANLDNAPKSGFAGSITAALFLRRFVDRVPWVHFDIFGWNPTARPGRPKGGECQAARALLSVLELRYGGG